MVGTQMSEAGGERRFAVAAKSYDSAEHMGSNDDAFIASDTGLLVVCDGWGGHSGSDEAARIGVETAWEELGELPLDAEFDTVVRAERRAITRANERVLETGRHIGATATLAKVVRQPSGVYVVGWSHVGDSRLYLWRSGARRLFCLTQDQSAYTGGPGLERDDWRFQQLLSTMRSPADLYARKWQGISYFAERLMYRHKVRSSLGVPPERLDVTSGVATLEPGDALYDVSDGASDNLTDPELAVHAACIGHVGIAGVVTSIADAAWDRSMDEDRFRHKPDDITVTGLMLRA